MKIVAVIPAYNEAQTIGEVVDRTRPHVAEVIVVDDGSLDRTAEIARGRGARVVRHPINRGLGASLGTGFAAARLLDADAAVTLDADGQHDPSEIPQFVAALAAGNELVLGTRMQDPTGMPLVRRLAQWCGNAVTFCLFGAWVSDSQSGYRALSRAALARVEIRTNRMEVSSEIVAESRRLNLRIAEVPIKAIYTDYSLSKGQGFFVGLKTLLKLVLRRIS
jgi:glycosyltransferase involved in cell wall biosynthesis